MEVEIKSCDLADKEQMFYPANTRTIKPIVTAYLEEIERQDLIKTYGLEGFDVQCINPRKTICDKISRLVKLSYNENANELLAKHIRDVYDLSVLFHNPEYKEYLLSDEFLEAMYKVTLEDGLNKNSRSHLPLADAPIFKEAKATMGQSAILAAYTTDLKKLTFNKEKMPTVEKAVEALEGLYEVLMRFEEFRKEKE